MATVDLQQTDTSKTPQVGCSGRSATAGTNIARECTAGGTAGTVEVLPALANLETVVVAYEDISGEIGETTWASGTYTWRLNITTTSAFITLQEVHICRLNTAEVSQESLGSVTGLGQSLGSSGVISGGISCSAGSSPLATDKIAVIYVFSNSSEHGGDDAFGHTPNQLINTPIEASDTALVINAGVDALTLTTFNTTTNSERSFTAGVDTLGMTEFNTTINAERSIDAAVATLSLTAFDTTIDIGADTTIDAGVVALTLTTFNATINSETSFTAAVDALTLTSFNAGINSELSFTTNVDALSLTDFNVSINSETQITTTVDALTLTSFNATIVTGGDLSINAGVANLPLTTYSATINSALDIQANVDALTLVSYNVTIEFGSAFKSYYAYGANTLL